MSHASRVLGLRSDFFTPSRYALTASLYLFMTPRHLERDFHATMSRGLSFRYFSYARAADSNCPFCSYAFAELISNWGLPPAISDAFSKKIAASAVLEVCIYEYARSSQSAAFVP